MKRCLAILILVIGGGYGTYSQSKIPPLDQSIMDMSYYPATYPILKIQDKATEPPLARVIYSRPLRNGRDVFGELVEYGKIWRLGANEATEIEFFKNVSLGGKPVPKGRYTLCCIPSVDKWTIIINKEVDTWGSFIYDAKHDLARIDVPVQKLSEAVEAFSLYFNKSATGFDLVAAWENTMVNIPFTVPVKMAAKTSVKTSKKL